MEIFSAAITIFFVMDPIGNIPSFLSVLKNVDPARRRRVLLRELLIAFGVLIGFLFLGSYILAGMRVTGPALGIAGGIILFLIALRMVFPSTGASLIVADKENADPLIIPLAVPLIAGPSSMATVILLGSAPGSNRIELLAALFGAWAVASLILLFSETLGRWLGPRFFSAMERLMGLILTTMAVQMFLNGIHEFLMQGR